MLENRVESLTLISKLKRVVVRVFNYLIIS